MPRLQRSLRQARRGLAVLTTTLVVGSVAITGSPIDAAEVGETEPSVFVPVSPCRLLDTRLAGSPDRLGARGQVDVAVADECGVADDAVAAAVTVTAVQASASGFVTAYPKGSARPTTSVVNYRPGDVIANHQFVQLGDGGAVSLYSLAAADLVVDVTGYFVPASGGVARAGRYVPVEPRRLIDTRTARRPSAGSSITIDPEIGDDAIAVALNITTNASKRPGHFTAYAAGSSRPGSSVLNVDRVNQTRAASVVVPLSDDGIEVYTSADNHIIVDITGYFTASSAVSSSAGLFVGVPPTRLVDTRAAYGANGGPRLWDHGTREFSVDDLTGGGVAAIAANVTVTETEDPGHLVAYPARTAVPKTSTVNYDRAQHTIANFAVLGVSTRGIAVEAIEATDVVVDVGGWFTGSPVAATRSAPENDPPADRRVTIIGDSAMAGLRWNGAYGGLQGFDAVPILESCRRLSTWSCRGREGYAPRSARAHIDSVPPAGPEDILVVATGYNDWHGTFAADFDAVIDAARRKGFHHIAWVDYRSDVGYRLPGSGGTQSNYGEMNRVIAEKLASGAFPDVRRWSLDSYSAGSVGWFTYDGVHQTRLGSFGVADWISRHVRAFDDRPCALPWTVGGTPDDPCPNPDEVRGARGLPDIPGLYGVS